MHQVGVSMFIYTHYVMLVQTRACQCQNPFRGTELCLVAQPDIALSTLGSNAFSTQGTHTQHNTQDQFYDGIFYYRHLVRIVKRHGTKSNAQVTRCIPVNTSATCFFAPHISLSPLIFRDA